MAECYNKIYIEKYDIEVECGKCLNCIENRQKEASARMAVEMSKYNNKYFVTLTYDPLLAKYDDKGQTVLDKKHLKSYIQALQYMHKQYSRIGKEQKMLYIASGEYGENATKRAHYHMVIATNIFIERAIKMKWKYGRVEMQRLRDVRAVKYTAGYSIKKMGRDKNDKEIKPFVKWSRGLGQDWINEKIKTTAISPQKYYLETIMGKERLPRYFKNKIKYHIMGVTPKYKLCNEVEKKLFKRKTYMTNRKEYTDNLWKWTRFITEVKEEAKKRDLLYLDYENMKKKYGDSWKARLYNLMYNEKWDEMDEVERNFSELKIRMNEKRRIEAEQKWFNKQGRRAKAG